MGPMIASLLLAQLVLPVAVTAELGHFQVAQPECPLCTNINTIIL